MADPAQVQALIAGDQGAFEQLVQGLMSSQNQSRQAAEALFNQMKEANGDACVTNLVALLRTSPQQDSRTLTAVLLRKVVVCLSKACDRSLHGGRVTWTMLNAGPDEGRPALLGEAQSDHSGG